MIEGIEIIKCTFDNMENRNARREESIYIFMNEPNGKTAYSKASEYFRNLAPESYYLGWDLEVYPCYKLIRRVLE